MKKILIIGILLLLGAEVLQAQQLNYMRRSLFSDIKALNVGDAITVFIVEEVNASNNAQTDDQRRADLGIDGSVALGNTPTRGGANLGTNNNFRGRGNTTRNERIRSRLSATVLEVFPNGNMRIEGTRTSKINGETQTVTLRGTVRPVDIRDDNSVMSYNISDLTLFLEGEGAVTDAQEPGIITKLLRLLF